MNRFSTLFAFTALPLLAALLPSPALALDAADAPSASTLFLKNPVKADPGLKSVGPLAFGASGLLLVAEPSTASIIALDTGDAGPVHPLAQPIADTAAAIAAALQAPAAQIQIVNMAVNPASGNVYFSVRNNAAKNVAIVRVDGSGHAQPLNLAALPHVKVSLPKAEATPIRNISCLAIAGQQMLVTGQSNEEFSSKIFSIPLPLGEGVSGGIYSAETYHVSHKRWETKAPIQSFIPYDDHGTPCVLGAFACTPIAKFPLKDIASGANIRGVSVVELGSGNRPLDLFAYTNATGTWLVCNTLRFHQPLFGNSKYWGVRVNASLLSANAPDKINENAVRRNEKEKTGPQGIEILDSLSGAVQVAKLNDQSMIVLRESGDKLKLEAVALP